MIFHEKKAPQDRHRRRLAASFSNKASLPEPLVADIEAESRGRKISKSDVVREWLERAPRQRRRTASLTAIADLIGSVDGLPSDLTVRKKEYLHAKGYGEKRPR
jgi:hypothetical protein